MLPKDIVKRDLSQYIKGNVIVLYKKEVIKEKQLKDLQGNITVISEHVGTTTIEVDIDTFILFFNNTFLLPPQANKTIIDKMIETEFRDESGKVIDIGYKKYLEQWKQKGITFEEGG